MSGVLDQIKQYAALAYEMYAERYGEIRLRDICYVLFDLPYYPVLFIIHALYLCVLIRRNYRDLKWYKSLLLGYVATFGGRVLLAMIVHREPPLLAHPFYSLIFIAIWTAINSFIYDLVYVILNSRFISFFLQLFYGIQQVREIFHGVQIGSRAFPHNWSAAIMLGVILSGFDCFVMSIPGKKIREFSGKTLLRIILITIIYQASRTEGPAIESFVNKQLKNINVDYTFEMFTGNTLRLVLLAVMEIPYFLEMLFFGVRDPRGIDITLVSLFGLIFKYRGSE